MLDSVYNCEHVDSRMKANSFIFIYHNLNHIRDKVRSDRIRKKTIIVYIYNAKNPFGMISLILYLWFYHPPKSGG